MHAINIQTQVPTDTAYTPDDGAGFEISRERIVRAILIAPLSAYQVMVIPLSFLEQMWGFALLLGFYAVVVSYVGMLFIGIPSISLLVYLRATRWWYLTLAGAVGGVCMWVVTGEEIVSLGSACAATFGVVVAGVAWYIGFRRLPTMPAPDQP